MLMNRLPQQFSFFSFFKEIIKTGTKYSELFIGIFYIYTLYRAERNLLQYKNKILDIGKNNPKWSE